MAESAPKEASTDVAPPKVEAGETTEDKAGVKEEKKSEVITESKEEEPKSALEALMGEELDDEDDEDDEDFEEDDGEDDDDDEDFEMDEEDEGEGDDEEEEEDTGRNVGTKRGRKAADKEDTKEPSAKRVAE